MSNDNNDNENGGGVILGGISFGMGSQPQTVNQGQAAASDNSATSPAATDPTPNPSVVKEAQALLPLRVLAVADLVPAEAYNRGARAPERPLKVEGRELDSVFSAIAPRLALEIETVLGAKQRVDLDLTSLKSFRPDSLCDAIPLLRSLLDGKRVLEQLREGSITVEQTQFELNRLWHGSPFVSEVLGGVETVAARGGVQAAPATPLPETTDNDVSRLLDMVDTGTKSDATSVVTNVATPARPAATSSGASKGRFDGFLAAVAHSGKADRPGARPDEAIRTVEKAVGLQLGAIVQHEEFRRLEKAWRGLAFLVGRCPKAGVRIEVVSAPHDDMPAALQRALDAGVGLEAPVSYAVVDTEITGDATGFARMRELAEVGENNAVPIIAAANASLLGQDDLSRVERLDYKGALFEAPERAPWRKEAHRPASRWLSLTMNRILAREAYDSRTSRVREATIEEAPDGPESTVWLSSCWAVATLPMVSFDRHQWPHRITGAPEGGVIEDLPVREVSSGYESEKVAIPTEAFFSVDTQRALGRIGIMALASQPNNDAAFLMTAATAYVPPPKKTYDTAGAETEVRFPVTPLVDQLFVARLVGFLQALGSRIGASSAPAEVQPVIEAALWELFDGARPGSVELVTDVSSGNSGLSATVTVRPRGFLGVSMEEITLGVPLR